MVITMTTPDTPPTRAEIKEQLRHMLASPRFRNAQNPSAFLLLVTQRKLEGKKTTGNVVKEALFKGKFEDKSVITQPAHVRVAAINLRKTLAKYYAAEGHNDVVVISLPTPPKDKHVKLEEGSAYTPTFAYKPDFFMMATLRFAYVCIERWSFTNLRRAFTLFSELLEKDFSPIGPAIGLVETHCQFAYRGWYKSDFDWLALCRVLLDGLPKEAHGYWRYWAAWGAVHVVNEDFEQAKGAFGKALALDRARTEVYEQFIYFLISTGRVQEGITFANRYLDERMDDGFAHALFAMFLILGKRWDAGCKQLDLALQIDPGNCRAHEMLAIVSIANGKLPDFVARIQLLKTLYDAESYEALIKYFLGHCEGLHLPAEVLEMLRFELNACGPGPGKP
jgi:tetratricopeptide (TPR) repeat protein